MMQLGRLFRRRADGAAAEALYLRLVAQVRQPGFYVYAGVPDTLDGRFDTILVHVFLVLHRLKGLEGPAAALRQDLLEVMLADMDRNLRELGVGDLSVGKHVKRMVAAFGGRMEVYDAALAASDGALEEALRRNLYGTVTPDEAEVACMAAYLRAAAESLEAQPIEALLAGRVAFGPVPGG